MLLECELRQLPAESTDQSSGEVASRVLPARATANRLGHGGELLPNLRGRDGPFRRGGETLLRFVRPFREPEKLGNPCRGDVEHVEHGGQKNPEIEPEAPGIHITITLVWSVRRSIGRATLSWWTCQPQASSVTSGIREFLSCYCRYVQGRSTRAPSHFWGARSGFRGCQSEGNTINAHTGFRLSNNAHTGFRLSKARGNSGFAQCIKNSPARESHRSELPVSQDKAIHSTIRVRHPSGHARRRCLS